MNNCDRCGKEWTEIELEYDKIYGGGKYYCEKCVTKIRRGLEEIFGHYLTQHDGDFTMYIEDWEEVLNLIKYNADIRQFEITDRDLACFKGAYA